MTTVTSCSETAKDTTSQASYCPQVLHGSSAETAANTESVINTISGVSSEKTSSNSQTSSKLQINSKTSSANSGINNHPNVSNPSLPKRDTVDPGKIYTVDFSSFYEQNNKIFSQALIAAINKGKSLAAAEINAEKAYTIQINVPKSTYIFSSAIQLRNISNVKINGNGSTFVYKAKCSAVQMEKCSNITWNDITVDFDPLLFTQGVITKIADNYIDVKIDAGYSTNLDYYVNGGNNSANIMDASVGGMKAGTRDSFAVKSYTKNNDGTYRMDIGWNINTKVSDDGQYFVKKGDLFVIRSGCVQTMVANWCKNITYENIILYNGGGSGFLEWYGDGGNIYRNVKITPGPKPSGANRERLASITGDGIHSGNVKVGPLVENCLFEKQGDDGINIHGFYGFGVQQVDKKTWIVSPKYIDIIQTGDEVEITDAYTYETKKVTKAVKVSKVTKPSLKSLAEEAWNGKHPAQSFTNFLQITFADEVQLELGDGVASLTHSGAGCIVRNSTFRHLRSRGILVKSANSLIENNTVTDCGLSGIMCSTEIGYWGEAHFVRNMIIRNNKISNCNTSVNCRGGDSEELGAITVSLFGPLNYTGMFEVQQNKTIIIENNIISDTCAYGMALTNIAGLKISDNTVNNTWKLGIGSGGRKFGLSEVTGHIFIGNSSNVIVSGNTYENNQYIKEKVQISGVTNYQIS